MNINLFLVIPAYNPSVELVKLIETILNLDNDSVIAGIIVINDGSDGQCNDIFNKIAKIEHVVILKHATNLGKGAALKTGFNYVLVHYTDTPVIVTADADGQHKAEDILRVVKVATLNLDTLVLGARVFGKGVPIRSQFGNQLTRLVVHLFTGLKLLDTQTGLRAWPRQLCINALKININGYDFEMECLVKAKQIGATGIKEVPIQTIYEKKNQSSHFNPMLDSMRIYFVFLRYSSTAMTASLLDYILFITAFSVTRSVIKSLIFARFLAIIAAYGMARQIVFKDSRPFSKTLPLYFVLVIGYMIISYGSISYLNEALGFNVVYAKLITESLLFFASFTLLRELVFKNK